MDYQEIIVTNKIDSGTAFATTLRDPAEAVFIPGKVATASAIEVGGRYMALLAPNVMRPDKTPWMAVRINPDRMLDLETLPNIARDDLSGVEPAVRRILQGGGVWSIKTLLPEMPKTNHPEATVASKIHHALHAMFEAGECAMFQLWSEPGRTKPSREWFTCFPNRADVDEWVDE